MKLRILVALPGLHLVHRGAEAAFENIATELARRGHEVTLIGAGAPDPGKPYRFLHAPLTPREKFARWPRVPPLRSEYRYEELSFAPGLWRAFEPAAYDLTLTCSYPFVNWVLRAKRKGRQPAHVYVTENGDHACATRNREYRWFGCEGLVCTNPEYLERNQARWNCALIPNGVDTARFTPGPEARASFGWHAGRKIILIVSALIPSKRVEDGLRAAALVPDAELVLAGDGPLRDACEKLGGELFGPRFRRLTVSPARMPDLYRSADVLLHMSREEAFGNIYIESLACGIPVVAHDYPTTRWILGEHESCVDTAIPANTAMALRTALETRSPERARAASESIHARFSWTEVGRQYEAFLTRVAEGAS